MATQGGILGLVSNNNNHAGEPSAVAGPSRPRRAAPLELGDRIVALQRKNASAPGPSRVSLRSREVPAEDEFSRGPSSSAHRGLYDPSRLGAPPAIAPGTRPSVSPRLGSPLPTPPQGSAEDEFARGPPTTTHRGLYDPTRLGPAPSITAPTRPNPASRLGSPLPPNGSPLLPPSPGRHPRDYTQARHHDRSQPSPSRHAESDRNDYIRGPMTASPLPGASRPSSSSGPSRQLFDPSVHDPHAFSRPTPPLPSPLSHRMRDPAGPPSSFSRASGSGVQLNGVYPAGADSLLSPRRGMRSLEDEADRERERRRRKEGSERGSQAAGGSGTGSGSSGRRRDDARSKGSRSSEGSESFKDRERGKGKGDTGVKAILKELHDRIKALEAELTEAHRKMTADPEAGISVLQVSDGDGRSWHQLSAKEKDDAELKLWLELIWKHKQLADLHHDFLIRIFDPLVPSSLHQLTIRYNIPSRLWQVGYHLILERLRHSWMTGNALALDMLTDFVYDAYKFYTDLLEDQALGGFRTAWIEALGDLARYRMAIASRLSQSQSASSRDRAQQSGDEVAEAVEGGVDARNSDHRQNEAVPDGASIGADVAERWDVEDTDTWRQTARDWYSMGISEKPGEGRLHHHLALLARDVPGGQGRALHHFAKSLVVTHEFPTARESILGLFDLVNDPSPLPPARKAAPVGLNVMALFIRLHGMLFTRINLDRFDRVLEDFLMGLERDGAGQADWMIMAATCLAGMMQYGLSDGVLRQALAQEGAERRKAHAGGGEGDDEAVENGTGMGDVNAEGNLPHTNGRAELASSADGKHATIQPEDPDTWPIQLNYAFRLAFAFFAHTLRCPAIAQGAARIVNPFLTTFLTFLATLSRQSATAQIINPWIPWRPLVDFTNHSLPTFSPSAGASAPRSDNADIKPESKLISGQPLPEDWLLRGSEWVGRRVYERGFWKTKSTSGRGSGGSGIATQPVQRSVGERFTCETDVLLAHYDEAPVDPGAGVVDREEDEKGEVDGAVEVGRRRARRCAWAMGVMVRFTEGLDVDDGRVKIGGEVVEMEEARRKREETRGQAPRGNVSRTMGLVEDEEGQESGEQAEEDPEVLALRERFAHLQSLLPANQRPVLPSDIPPRPSSKSIPTHRSRPSLNLVPGYTILVFDTNVLLSSLSHVTHLVSSHSWRVVIPLPVIVELDGLSREPAPLGWEAKAAIHFLEGAVKSHGLYLKIQTTKGSYLPDLSIRTESTTDGDAMRGSMDERILSVAKWQTDNFVDRSNLLAMGRIRPDDDPQGQGDENDDNFGKGEACKAVLVTFDRNLRLMARGRGVDAVDEREMASLLGGRESAGAVRSR